MQTTGRLTRKLYWPTIEPFIGNREVMSWKIWIIFCWYRLLHYHTTNYVYWSISIQARAIDKTMAIVKRTYILIIEMNKWDSFLFHVVFPKRKRKHFFSFAAYWYWASISTQIAFIEYTLSLHQRLLKKIRGSLINTDVIQTILIRIE